MRKPYHLLLGLFFVLVTSCSEDLPEAIFTIDQSTSATPSLVRLTNESVNASSFEWDFGDGHTSTTKNTTHTYYDPGNYTIELIAYNDEGKDISTQQIEVTQGTSFRVYNKTVYTLFESFAFLNDNNVIKDKKNLGSIYENEYSREILTTNKKLSVIFKHNGITYLVVSPFYLTANTLNTGEINNATSLQAVTINASPNKNSSDLSFIGKKIKISDL